MRSYALAIAASMLLAAIYVFQNDAGEVTVRFLIFERVFPQGVWEVLLFSVGAVVMWVFSILASLELRASYRGKIKERDKKIQTLEDEKSSLLGAISKMGAKAEYPIEGKPYVGLADEPFPPAGGSGSSADGERV